MEPKLLIQWKDGRETDIPDPALGDRFGENVLEEQEWRFDAAAEGLVLELRHHMPPVDDDGAAFSAAAADPWGPDREDGGAGGRCTVEVDCHCVIVGPESLGDVLAVYKDGRRVMASIAGELAVIAKIDALSDMYLNEERDWCDLLKIAALSERVGAALAVPAPEGADADAAVARELGVSVATLRAARAYKAERDALSLEGGGADEGLGDPEGLGDGLLPYDFG